MNAGVLVVGAGLGGLRAAEGLRASGYTGAVTVVGDEAHPPYNRPPLTKEALARGVEPEALHFRRRPSVGDVTWRAHTRVVALDVDARRATTDEGEQLGYEAVVIATGVSARRIPVPGPSAARGSGRHVVRTIEDAAALRAQLVSGARVVVLGAGFIGCEVAATAIGLGADVRCVAMDRLPMIRPLGDILAGELRRRHEERGVVFHLGVGVVELLGDESVTAVVLSDGTTLQADVVVEALGSSCNVGLLDGQGFDLSDGVLVDSALRPIRDGRGIDGVAIVGDLARFPNPRFGPGAYRVEHWSVPTDTGRRAGAVLAAHLSANGYDDVVAAPFEVLPSFWSDQYDTRIQSYGMPGLVGSGGIRVLEGDVEGECVVGYFEGDELLGVVGLGMMRAVNGYAPKVGIRAG